MEEIQDMLRSVFLTNNKLTIPISSPGSVGMETCLVNLLEPGDTALVCINGAFGKRMEEIVQRCGAKAITNHQAWGEPVEIGQVEATLKANPEISVLSFVHAETSTGAKSDAANLCSLAAEHDVLSVVDAVTSLGGIPVEVARPRRGAVVDGW